ncbi:MAG: hypothetical protein RLY87_486 [Chloroflexota bacterium]|jgi:hypothetical protein
MRRSLALVFLSIVTLSVLTACSAVTHQINVTAPDVADLCGLYVSPAGANTYGANALADGTVLAAQAEMSIPVDAAGDYDLKLVACDGREEVMPINVP